MTDLTEQWKKGKLESGFYYVYLKYLRMFDIATSSTLFGILERGNENCLEILAPVPSYEQWQEYVKANDSIFSVVKMLNKDNYQLEKENKQLKELLKECKRYIDFWGYTDSHGNFLYPQIENAIGEK